MAKARAAPERGVALFRSQATGHDISGQMPAQVAIPMGSPTVRDLDERLLDDRYRRRCFSQGFPEINKRGFFSIFFPYFSRGFPVGFFLHFSPAVTRFFGGRSCDRLSPAARFRRPVFRSEPDRPAAQGSAGILRSAVDESMPGRGDPTRIPHSGHPSPEPFLVLFFNMFL